jgi:hypothetical protein
MNYRNIWVKHNGKIPVDENGVSFEIHHIDGNRSNNNIDNLTCVSIKEHFSIHHSQGDWQAAERILQKIKNIEALKELGWTPKTYAKWQSENKIGLWSLEIQAKALKTKQDKKVGFCHDPKWSSIGGKLGGKKGALITNVIHKKNGTGVYSKEHQSKAGKAGGAIAGKLPKSDAQKIKISEGLKRAWEDGTRTANRRPKLASKTKEELSELRKQTMKDIWIARKAGLLPPRKSSGPRGSYKKKVKILEENSI